jgi:threonine dehydrogenase-like Zn-dependent dehydrogenase
LGLFVTAFAIEAGASPVVVIGTGRGRARLALAQAFGATETLCTADTTADERIACTRDLTTGRGADVVIDCAGTETVFREGLAMVAAGGTYALPGVAAPLGESPVRLYEEVSRKNVRIQGVWVSDTSHLCRAVELVESRRFPFESLVTHTFALDEVNRALQVVDNREAVKAVLAPQT